MDQQELTKIIQTLLKKTLSQNFSENLTLTLSREYKALWISIPSYQGIDFSDKLMSTDILSLEGLNKILKRDANLLIGLSEFHQLTDSVDEELLFNLFKQETEQLGYPHCELLKSSKAILNIWCGFEKENQFKGKTINYEVLEKSIYHYCIRFLNAYFKDQKSILNPADQQHLTQFAFYGDQSTCIIINDDHQFELSTSLTQYHSLDYELLDAPSFWAICYRVLEQLKASDQVKSFTNNKEANFVFEHMVAETEAFSDIAASHINQPLDVYFEACRQALEEAGSDLADCM